MTLNSSMSDSVVARFFTAAHEPSEIPVLKLAFVGDAVFELLVREALTDRGTLAFEELSEAKSHLVCAGAQAIAVDLLLDSLTPAEEEIYRRGRNAKHKTVPKNSTHAEYAKATGLETLLGYLYLSGQKDRILEIWSIIDPTKGVKRT